MRIQFNNLHFSQDFYVSSKLMALRLFVLLNDRQVNFNDDLTYTAFSVIPLKHDSCST